MRLYEDLRRLMKRRRYSMTDLALILKMSPQSLSARFTGRVSFSLDECYTILDVLEEDPTSIGYYFPPIGIAKRMYA